MNLIRRAILKMFPFRKTYKNFSQARQLRRQRKKIAELLKKENAKLAGQNKYDGYNKAERNIDLNKFFNKQGVDFNVARAFIRIDGKLQPVVTVDSLLQSAANCVAYFEAKIIDEGSCDSYETAVRIYSFMRDFFIEISKPD